jgi:hypothetical protein
MAITRHCRHCLGNCNGDCLLPGDSGLCIHNPVPKRSMREWAFLVRTRGFWHRVLWGIFPRPVRASRRRQR